ncbi:hypothetical protein AGMMS50262_17870 [Bacteroidia bacterium]|nr:hypothetical protein AGMMS50262_17870 [Bacteroidia bacterium]
MKKLIIYCVAFLFLNSTNVFADETDSLYIRLNKLMDTKEQYMQNKEQNILQLKQVLSIGTLLPEQIYEVNRKLYEEYRKYQSDSAIHYVLKNQEIAGQLGQEPLKIEADLQLSWLYMIKGMYIESTGLLENIRKENLPEDFGRHLL